MTISSRFCYVKFSQLIEKTQPMRKHKRQVEFFSSLCWIAFCFNNNSFCCPFKIICKRIFCDYYIITRHSQNDMKCIDKTAIMILWSRVWLKEIHSKETNEIVGFGKIANRCQFIHVWKTTTLELMLNERKLSHVSTQLSYTAYITRLFLLSFWRTHFLSVVVLGLHLQMYVFHVFIAEFCGFSCQQCSILLVSMQFYKTGLYLWLCKCVPFSISLFAFFLSFPFQFWTIFLVDGEPREIQFWIANSKGASYFSLAVHGQSLFRWVLRVFETLSRFCLFPMLKID